MTAYKIQATSGPLAVHFSVASVAYDLYRSPNCKYHDPVNASVSYSEEMVQRLSREYYDGWNEFLSSDLFEVTSRVINARDFFLLRFNRAHVLSVLCLPNQSLFGILLDKRIGGWAESGGMPQRSELIDEEGVFVDSDGIGLQTIPSVA